MILDTSFVIDVMDSGESIAPTDWTEARANRQYLASVTVLELYEGVVRAMNSERERRNVLDVLDTKVVLPADASVMRTAGRISGRLVARGERIERGDCVIAATALVNDEPIVTRNVDHFGRIDGVDVLGY